ncbi:MAG TPA: hypothetical protein VHU84_12665, partial [Lacipirellulaceae bacterium]|nr:hypothetical protein [Lacipirellulaceae bacterium]
MERRASEPSATVCACIPVGTGCVENLNHDKNHDVVGEDEQAEFAALAVVGAGMDVSALAALDHGDDG